MFSRIAFLAVALWAIALSSRAQPSVRVLEAGAEPRRELRYRPTVGETRTLVVALEMTTKMDMPGMPSMGELPAPTTKMTSSVRIDEVDATGNVAYTTKIERFDFSGGDPAAAAMLEGMKSGMNGLAGTETRGRIDARGRSLAKTATPAAGPAAGFPGAGGLDQMTIPFPEEAVGVGAKWEIVESIDQGGFAITMTSVATLTALDEAGASVELAATGGAPAGKISPPGAPPGMAADLKEMKMSASAKAAISFASLVPTAFEQTADVSMAMAMTVPMPDGSVQSQEMAMSQKMRTTVSAGGDAAGAPVAMPAAAPAPASAEVPAAPAAGSKDADLHKATVHIQLAAKLWDEADYAGALEQAIAARDLRLKHLPEDHPDVAKVKGMIQAARDRMPAP